LSATTQTSGLRYEARIPLKLAVCQHYSSDRAYMRKPREGAPHERIDICLVERQSLTLKVSEELFAERVYFCLPWH